MKVYFFAFGFIMLDFICGIIKAIALKEFSSTKMREGLFHKVALILVIILGIIIDYAQVYIDIGFSIPVCTALSSYIILMEISSIIENIGKINPDIIPEKLMSIFKGEK